MLFTHPATRKSDVRENEKDEAVNENVSTFGIARVALRSIPGPNMEKMKT
jgi:hypothetical protein